MRLESGQIHMMHLKNTAEDNLHRHNFFELVYVLSGQCEHHLEGEKSVIKAGDYFIIDTGSEHCYKNNRELEIINCLFMPDYIDRALTDCPTLAALLSDKLLHLGVPVDIKAADRTFYDKDGSVGRLMVKMVKEYEQKSTGYMELLRCYLTQALVSAVRACEETKEALHPATRLTVDYLQANYQQPLSLDKISKTVGYAPSYISGVFAKDTGMTVREFLQRLRVEKACSLLSETALPVPQIGQQVGYEDYKHFALVFKRCKGMPPLAFRKNKNGL